jgi:RNA polymerase sigma factor (sigma-70 family)
MVGPRTAVTERSVAEQLAAVEPLVGGICRSRLGAADGDDAAQRTMVTLWRRLEAADRPRIESLPGYATVCARYEVLASLGEFQRRPTVAIGEATERACVDDAPGPEAQALRAAEVAEAAARVEQLLGALTPREVEVLRATKLAATEPDTATAARELGISPTSVRSAQVRAMARLRELCGTRSPNPLASPVPLAERRKAAWTAAWTARSARAAEQMAHPSPAQAEFAGEFLRRRLDGGLSQSQLGAALGCDGSYVSKVERGKTWPSREFARRVDEVLATGEAFQDRHGRHSAETARANAEPAAGAAEPGDVAGAGPLASRSTDTEVSAAESTRARDRVTDETATDGSSADPGSAAAACAVARAAVQAAVARVSVDAQDDERAGQLARWHADDNRADLDADGRNDTAGDDAEWRAADRGEAEAVAS